MRVLGPNCKAGKPDKRKYNRNLKWELALPDSEVPIPWERQLPAANKTAHKRKWSPTDEDVRKRARRDGDPIGGEGMRAGTDQSQGRVRPEDRQGGQARWEPRKDGDRRERKPYYKKCH